MSIDKDLLRQLMSQLGKRGGQAKSQAKTDAARRNAGKPRRRLCKGCQAELTSADREMGACTQCRTAIKRH